MTLGRLSSNGGRGHLMQGEGWGRRLATARLQSPLVALVGVQNSTAVVPRSLAASPAENAPLATPQGSTGRERGDRSLFTAP